MPLTNIVRLKLLECNTIPSATHVDILSAGILSKDYKIELRLQTCLECNTIPIELH